MSMIRDFFKKKKIDKKFKQAGPGHRLTDTTSNPPSTSQSQRAENTNAGSSRPVPAKSAAAEAAMLRLQQQSGKGSQKALGVVLEEERKKVLEEYKAKEEAEAIKQAVETERFEPTIDMNVKFCCQSLYITDGYPLNQLKAIIEDGIKESYKEDRLIMNALLIKNCNAEAESQLGLATIERVLSNLKTDDAEQQEKFKKLRKSKLEQKLQNVKGGIDFIKAAGFSVDETNEWLVYTGESAAISEHVDYYLDVLRNAEKFELELDREPVIITKDDMNNTVEELDEQFYKLTAADIAREQESLTKARELNETLMTKEMRSRLNRKTLTKYTRLRMRLPDDTFVEATFRTKETINDLRQWLLVTFSDKLENFSIVHSGKTVPQEAYTKTFEQLDMYPAAFVLVRNN